MTVCGQSFGAPLCLGLILLFADLKRCVEAAHGATGAATVDKSAFSLSGNLIEQGPSITNVLPRHQLSPARVTGKHRLANPAVIVESFSY